MSEPLPRITPLYPSAHPPFREPVPPREPEVPTVISPAEVLHAVRRRRWTVLLVTLAVATLVHLVLGDAAPSYAASAVIRLADARRAIGGGFVDPSLRAEGSLADPILTQIQILRSRAIASRAVASPEGAFLRVRTVGFPAGVLAGITVDSAVPSALLELEFGEERVVARGRGSTAEAAYGAPLTVGGVTFAVTHHPQQADGTLRVLTVEQAVQGLVRGTVVKKREGTDVVDVTFNAVDPHLAQQGVNLLTRTFQEANLAAVRERSLRRRRFLEEQLAENAELSDRARDSLTRFRSRQRALSSRDRFSREQAEVSAQESQFAVVATDQRNLQLLLRRIESTPVDADLTPVRVALAGATGLSPTISQIGDELLRLDRTRDSLTTGPFAQAVTNPDVVALGQRAASARQQLLDAVRSHLETVDGRAAELQRQLVRGSGMLGRMPEEDAEELRLTERQELYSRLTHQLREEYQRAQIADAVEGGDVEIVDQAPLPSDEQGLLGWRVVALGLFMGLGTGVTTAFGLEQFRRTMRRREDVETYLGLPSLAIIPMVRAPTGMRARIGRLTARSAAAEERGSRPIQGSGDAVSSLPEEAFRTLRTNLLFSDAGRSARTIAVTSARTGEGKTTVSANLALSLAQQGHRVLIVDCDLRRPRLHTTFKLPLSPGLSDVITGVTPAANATRATSYPNVSLLSAGGAMAHAVELFGVGSMGEALAGLARDFDLIIVDTPPILAAADATVVAAIADAVVFVIRAGRTSETDGRRALQQLERVGARVLGAVLNDRDQRSVGIDSYYQDVGSYVDAETPR